MNESVQVIKNKVRLVAQGYNKEEGIDMMKLMLLLLDGIYSHFACFCMLYKFQIISNKCQKCFLNGFIKKLFL